MKIIAIERELKILTDDIDETYQREALHVYSLYLKNVLREIYMTEANCAVIVLECESIAEANRLLAALPLVQAGVIEFEVHELGPYPGYGRLMRE